MSHFKPGPIDCKMPDGVMATIVIAEVREDGTVVLTPESEREYLRHLRLMYEQCSVRIPGLTPPAAESSD